MRIKKSSIEHIIRSIPLYDHLKNYMELKRSGAHYVAKCAFHQDQSPSMYVYPDHYHCFSCKAHGSIIRYEMHRSGASFREAAQYLAEKYRVAIDYEESENDQKYKEKNELIQKQEEFLQKFFEKACSGQNVASWVSSYKKEFLDSFSYLNPKGQSEKDWVSRLPLSAQADQWHLLKKDNGKIGALAWTSSQNQGESFCVLAINLFEIPLYGWQEARLEAYQKNQIVVTCRAEDYKILKELGINSVLCVQNFLSKYQVQQVLRKASRIFLVLPLSSYGKNFSFKTLKHVDSLEDADIFLNFIPEGEREKEEFLQSMSSEKFSLWLSSFARISQKVAEMMRASQPHQQKIIPPKIQEIVQKIPAPAEVPKPQPIVLPEESLASSSQLHPQIEMMSKAVGFYHHLLFTPEGHGARAYLQERGFSLEDLKRWQIGYCPTSHALTRKISSLNKNKEMFEKLGLIRKNQKTGHFYDFFYGRILIPIKSHKGEFIALSGRIFGQKEGDKKSPKYINSPESELFSKSHVLFHYDHAIPAIHSCGYAILVEGHMDCISMVNHGIRNVVAVMGTALTPAHLALLAKITKRLVVCFDQDEAGQSAARRSLLQILKHGGLEAEWLVLGSSKDPDEFLKAHGAAALQNLLAKRHPPLYMSLLGFLEERARDREDLQKQILHEFEEALFLENPLAQELRSFLQERYDFSFKIQREWTPPPEKSTSSEEMPAPVLGAASHSPFWQVKTPLEIRLLFALSHCLLSEIPQSMQSVLAHTQEESPGDPVCREALSHALSEKGFQCLCEIGRWMLQNPFVPPVSHMSPEDRSFSDATRILLAYMRSDIQILLGFHLEQLLLEPSVGGSSMVFSDDIWSRKGSGFLKFHLKNTNLAFRSGVVASLIREILFKVEMDYIDDSLKKAAQFHFDNEVNEQFMFWAEERARRQALYAE